MHRITLSSGRSFSADDGETLLDAALRAGVMLPYSCRTGRCSTCRSRVESGSTRALHAETGLAAAELAAGWVLGCVRSASSDVRLEVEDLGDVALPAPRTFPCRIQSIDPVAPGVLRIGLRLPPSAAFAWLPGQYVDVIGPGGLRRSYSIANAATPERRLELQVRRVDGGAFSDYWFGPARVEDLLRLHGPLGTFFLREVAGQELVFLATGTGIAPVKAIIEGLAALPAAAWPAGLRVYWGGRLPADLYWDPRTAAPPGAPAGWLRYVPVLSRADHTWPGQRGHVQHALLADPPDLAHTAVYACGSDTMIHDAHARLAAAGLPPGRFRSDAFVCSAAA